MTAIAAAAMNRATDVLEAAAAEYSGKNEELNQAFTGAGGFDERIAGKEAEVDEFKEQAAASIAEGMGAKGGLVPFMTTGGQVTWFFGIPKYQIEELRPDGTLGIGTHPAFIMSNDAEAGMLWYAAYDLSLKNGEMVSQPNTQPYTGRTFDEENALCAGTEIAGQSGHRNSSIWDNSLISLMIEKRVQDGGSEPLGNTSYGKSHSKTSAKGHGSSWIKSGTMGALANHNGESHGIADFVGNVWCRCAGMHLQDGEIFLSANNDPLMIDNPVSTGYFYSSSNASGDGTPSIVSSAGDVIRNGAVGDDAHGAYGVIGGAGGFSGLAGASNELLKLAGLAPHADTTDLTGAIWVRNYGRRAPLLRGGWGTGANAGPRALTLNLAPSYRYSNIGFRSAFVTGVQ